MCEPLSVGAGMQTLGLCKSSACSLLLSHLSSSHFAEMLIQMTNRQEISSPMVNLPPSTGKGTQLHMHVAQISRGLACQSRSALAAPICQSTPAEDLSPLLVGYLYPS